MPKPKSQRWNGPWHSRPCYHSVIDHQSRIIPAALRAIEAAKVQIDAPNTGEGNKKNLRTKVIPAQLNRLKKSFDIVAADLKKYGGHNEWRDFPKLEATVNVNWARIFNREGYLDEDTDFSRLPRFSLLPPPMPPAQLVPPEPMPGPAETASTKRGAEHSLEARPIKKPKASTADQANHNAPSGVMDDTVIPASPPVKFQGYPKGG